MSVSTHSQPSQSHTQQDMLSQSQPFMQSQSPRTEYSLAPAEKKRKRGDFELNVERSVDVVGKGLISLSDAEVYFRTFFRGCVSS
jgi:hypothetical protein